MGWYDEDSNGTMHLVAQKNPNAWGLYDMHDNVWEWCADRYGRDYYGGAVASKPDLVGPVSGSGRVLRGWADYAFCRLPDVICCHIFCMTILQVVLIKFDVLSCVVIFFI